MAKDSGIEWTKHTFNPWWGCTKVSAGCTNCYADTLATRFGFDIWGPKAGRRFFGDAHWAEPLRWNNAAVAAGERHRVFCASMADVFEQHMLEEVHDRMMYARQLLWKLIEATPALDWLLLTKRPENILSFIPRKWWLKTPPPNVWYGTSVEDQEQAEKRIPQLLRVPAAVRFLSCEPLLGPVDLTPWLWETAGPEWAGSNPAPGIDWVIAGGESGPGARPMHPSWARSLRDQCETAGVAYHFKQWGEFVPYEMQPGYLWHSQHGVKVEQDEIMRTLQFHNNKLGFARIGKKAAGRELDGRTWDEYPEVPA